MEEDQGDKNLAAAVSDAIKLITDMRANIKEKDIEISKLKKKCNAYEKKLESKGKEEKIQKVKDADEDALTT